MKNNVLIVGIVATTMLFSCGETVEKRNTPAEIIVTEVEQIGDNLNYVANIEIDGMTCAMGCAKTIENKLKAMNGVVSAKVDFENKVAEIEYDNNQINEQNFISEITSIHDNQYSIIKIKVEKPVMHSAPAIEKSEENKTTEESKEQVTLNYPSIHIPNILDALFKLLPY